MVANNRGFDAVVSRCRSSLKHRFLKGPDKSAGPLLEAELLLIQQQGWEEALVDIVEFGDRLRDKDATFHTIGAGASSVILFLLGYSEVDPVRFGTHFERFWCTIRGEPPTVQFVVMPAEDTSAECIPGQVNVTAHLMTALEMVPEILRKRLPDVTVSMTEGAVFAAIHSGDTDGVFQLESDSVRLLLSRLCPTRIKPLATVTALEQISHGNPEITEKFLIGVRGRAEAKAEGTTAVRERGPILPILFQETIMEQLRRQVQMPWDETYRFVQAAAKGKPVGGDDLKEVRIEKSSTSDSRQLLDRMAEASEWATCRAHHVANAITSYRAAYYRTFHRRAFEVALHQALSWERGN